MLGIRQKLSLGLAGLMITLGVIGYRSILQFRELGASIDVILRENYRSVIACQRMKESLERIDSGCLFTMLGDIQVGQALISKNALLFAEALRSEESNITVTGEGQKAVRVRDLFDGYQKLLPSIVDPGRDLGLRRKAYFERLFPLFNEIKDTTDDILRINQQNMTDANDRARRIADRARRGMYVLFLVGAIVSLGIVLLTGRWILRPIKRLIRSSDEIRRGNLDLVVPQTARDEIGRLSESFNEMAAALRRFRRSDQARIDRIQQATQRAFDCLPEALAVVDMNGTVELATESAKAIFGLRPDASLADLPFAWMRDLHAEALRNGRLARADDPAADIQHFVGSEERFFRPEALPILGHDRQPTGVILAIHDVTQSRQQDEIKRSVISTVSHQLKTPLTSIRMALHLLLEERIGPLTEQQAEVLVAARDDSDRLAHILSNLLDLGRIASGKADLELKAVSPLTLVLDGFEPFRRTAQDQGIDVSVAVPPDLPGVWADGTRMFHVFGNLISNALRYTPAGGRIKLSAEAEESHVRFSVADTGPGIPAQYLPRIFEEFFRVPDRASESGAGLGLAIVKKIVEAHGGSVGVESHEGQGTTFSFTLRRADRDAEIKETRE
jgi:signal transduction histidine kinase